MLFYLHLYSISTRNSFWIDDDCARYICVVKQLSCEILNLSEKLWEVHWNHFNISYKIRKLNGGGGGNSVKVHTRFTRSDKLIPVNMNLQNFLCLEMRTIWDRIQVSKMIDGRVMSFRSRASLSDWSTISQSVGRLGQESEERPLWTIFAYSNTIVA